MKKNDAFTDRRKDAESAKARLLEKFKARPSADDPAILEKEAARQKASAAKAERLAARAAEREAQAMAAAAAAETEKAAAQAKQREKATADEAAQKAARDARYAARKSRK